MSDLRKLISTLHREVNYSDPELLKQADSVDYEKLEPKIERMVRRASIIAHAFDVMKDGSYRHPLAAFVHATECPTALMGEEISDEEYFYLLDVWARLVNIKPVILTGGSISE
jgi:hypothetical protein